MAKKKYEEPFKLDMPFEEAMQRFVNVNTRDLTAETNPVQPDSGAAPFLKWVGGKRSIIKELTGRMPATYNNYFEPFIGGGALFFEIKPTKGHLSDANLDLIITYKVVQKDVEKLIEALKKHQRLHCEEYYYRVRSRHDLDDPVEVAARMIYLNKTCFNGLWRVNKKGEFNVPMGKYANPGICQEDNLRACSKALKNTIIEYKDYEKIEPKEGDFCYFDPPYHPINDTSFTAYSMSDFTEKDQQNLADFCKTLHRNGVKIMLSNSNTEFIRNLYRGNIFNINIVNAPRNVNCKPNGRNSVEEVLITNY
ncbi:DNA adenine methylase [Ferruginibacter sp.]